MMMPALGRLRTITAGAIFGAVGLWTVQFVGLLSGPSPGQTPAASWGAFLVDVPFWVPPTPAFVLLGLLWWVERQAAEKQAR
jgi:hypothetical protein